MKTILLRCLSGFTASLLCLTLQAQELVIGWQKSAGGNRNEVAYASTETSDGGLITVGSTNSRNNGDVKESYGYDGAGGSDMWVVKFSAAGSIEWSRTFGGTRDDVATGVVQTRNGDYVIIGTTQSTDGDALLNGSNGGLLMVRLNLKGEVVSKRLFAGGSRFQDGAFQAANSLCKAVIKVASNGDLVIGATKSLGSGSGKTYDFFLARLTSTGDTLWERTYGGGAEDYLNDFIFCSDGGFLLVGSTLSLARDITGAGKGFYDFLVVKATSTGAESWKRAYGGSSYDVLFSAIEIGLTNQFYLVGESSSADGDVGKGAGQKDGIVLKINGTGTMLSKVLYGGTGNDGFQHIARGNDGKLYLTGMSDSVIGAVRPKGPLSDVWMMVMEESGLVNYHKLLGGASAEVGRHGLPSAGGGVILSGSAASSDGDVGLNRGLNDLWVIKMQLPPPVVFGKFEAFLNEDQEIELAWTSTYEKDARQMLLEKSTDNKTFQRIYEVAAAGNSVTVRNYGFRDKNPVNGINYYRLRYSDKSNVVYEGRQTSYRFVPLSNESGFRTTLKVYPNPAEEFANLDGTDDAGLIEMVSVTGQIIPLQKQLRQGSGVRIQWDQGLRSGLYFIRLNGPEPVTFPLVILR